MSETDELIEGQVATQIEAAVEPGKTVDEAPQVSPEIQAELDRLNAKKLELEKAAQTAEERAIYWRKQKAEARAEYFKGDRREPDRPPAPQEPAVDVGPAPRKEDFEDYDKFMDATADYRAKLQIAQWRRDEEAKSHQTESKKKLDGLLEKLNKGYEKYPDFEEIARDPSVPITPVIVDILAESEIPEDVAYYLGKNRGEAIRLSRMTPIAAAKEVARIEMELTKTNPEIKITKAPPPIKPIGSGETVTKEADKMTQKEYEQWRNSQGARRF